MRAHAVEWFSAPGNHASQRQTGVNVLGRLTSRTAGIEIT